MDRTRHQVERDDRLLEHAVAALGRATGLEATVVVTQPKTRGGLRPDATLEIRCDGRRFRFLAEMKAIDRAVTLAHVKEQLAPFGQQGVLVAPYLTAELANLCREKLDLHFIDTAGNAFLRAPGLYVFIRGERPRGAVAPAVGTRGGGTATALRVVFALLCRPELLDAPYREIVAAAGVALGAVGWVFSDLQHRGYLTGGQRPRTRHLREPERLLQEWVTNYPIKLRPKLNPRRFVAPDPEWWQKAQLPEEAFWGGEVAGHKLTGHLKPATCTIYLNPAIGREGLTGLVKEHRLRADLAGDIEILDAFWHFPVDPKAPDVVPPLLAYADLLATLDPRNLEVAKRIREQHLQHALRRT